jgi:hypothetical protein
VFQRFFDHVVELCREAGLVRGQELLVDARERPGRPPAHGAGGAAPPGAAGAAGGGARSTG